MLYSFTNNDDPKQDLRRVSEAFAKLDGRERIFPVTLRPVTPGAPFVGAAAADSTIQGMWSVRFSPGAIDNAACQVQVYRGRAGGSVTALEISWVNEIAAAGSQAFVFDYTPVIARADKVILVGTVIQRTYTVPTVALTMSRDRVPLDGITVASDDILGVVITRRRDLAADTYKGAPSAASRRIHVVATSFCFRGADGEDV